MNAVELIRADHERFRAWFRDYQQAVAGSDQQQQIAREVLPMLDAHSRMEEEIFYPALRGLEEADEMLAEAKEEHTVQKNLVAGLKGSKKPDVEFQARFKVLSEYTEHHIQEEESEMLPKAAELGKEKLQELGQKMEERKMALMGGGDGKAKPAAKAKK